MQKLSFALLVAVTALGQGLDARAEPPPPVEDRVEADTARDLFRQGRELYKKNQIAEARAKFLAAFGVKKHWQIALNLGATELLLERYRDAAEHLAWADRESAGAPDDADLHWLHTRLPEAMKHVATLRVSAEAGLELRIDDDAPRITPIADPVFLEPGHHELGVRAPGRVPTRISLDLGAGESRQLDVAMPSPALPEPDIDINPDPPVLPPPAPGEARGSNGRTIVALTGGALALVSLGIGFYFFAKSESANSDAERLRASVNQRFGDPNAPGGPTGPGCTVSSELCVELSNAVYDRATAAERARAAFIASGVLAVATAGAWLLWPRRESSMAKRQLTVGAGADRIWVSGAF